MHCGQRVVTSLNQYHFYVDAELYLFCGNGLAKSSHRCAIFDAEWKKKRSAASRCFKRYNVMYLRLD